MSELGYLKAVLLGVIQGATEFLPISSSGHLVLTQGWMKLDPSGTEMLLFDVFAHVGTLGAVAIVFARPGGRFLRRLARESTRAWRGRRYAWRIALLTVAATIPTGAIGLGFKDEFEAAFGKPRWVGACLMATGVFLALLAFVPRPRRGWKDFRGWQAVLVGIGQGLAILPGISRSGITICIASYCGLRRQWAAQFSFLIAVPAISAATVLKLMEVSGLGSEQLGSVPWRPILLGSLVSFGVGVVALKLLLDAVRRAKLHYFAVYCWVIGALVLLR